MEAGDLRHETNLTSQTKFTCIYTTTVTPCRPHLSLPPHLSQLGVHQLHGGGGAGTTAALEGWCTSPPNREEGGRDGWH